MVLNKILGYIGIGFVTLMYSACIPKVAQKTANTDVPEQYYEAQDTSNVAQMSWRNYFTDSNLIALIDTALINNQELNITLQEINVAKSEVRARKGEYLPSVNLKAGAGIDKVGRYTRDGALEANNEIKPGSEFPEPYSDFFLGAFASWEIDIWKKLRNAKKAASFRYLASVEGKNFMVTNMVSEIANSYYELMALDNQLEIVKQNIAIQKDAMRIVDLQKQTGDVTELAVQKFKAEVYKNQSRQFFIQQMIRETENKLNFLVGRFPESPIERSSKQFNELVPDTVHSGIPSQLLQNRPDIRQAEMQLIASKLDIKVAKAKFYPSLDIMAGVGFQSFNLKYFFTSPQSILYNLAGDLMQPLINRNAIKAEYLSANAKQIQAAYNYERTILNAYIEVANQLSNISNLEESYKLQSKQVEALTKSIRISTGLFKSARADYMEVLMTQRDALESKMELIETKKEQMMASVKVYQALGGGWK